MTEHGLSSCPSALPGQVGAATQHPSWTDLATLVEKMISFGMEGKDTVVTQMLRTRYMFAW